MTNTLTADLETSIKNRGPDAVGKDKASPHCPKNKIVYVGAKKLHKDTGACRSFVPVRLGNEELLIGQNLKFDLLYLMREPENRAWMKTGKIWCTQLAEFLLTGQKHKYANLDDLATKYGGTLKDDRLKEMWAADIDTEDIPEDMILDYLKGDVENTELVFLGQLLEAKRLGMLPLIRTQMEALLATTEMEYNGLWFDKNEAMFELGKLCGKLQLIKDRMHLYMKSRIPDYVTTVNINSKDQLSALLFGGQLKYRADVPIVDENGQTVLFKSGLRKGQAKTRKEDKLYKLSGVFMPDADWETKKSSVYKTDEDVLNELVGMRVGGPCRSFVEDLLLYRSKDKEIGTYYKPYIELCWPHDQCIHGKLNHAATGTGRLASSSPNLQNVSNEND